MLDGRARPSAWRWRARFPSSSWPALVQGAADATVWGAGLAWLAARAPVERRGEVVGYAQVAATVGIITGPFVGGVLTSAVGIRPTFLGMAALFAVLLVGVVLEPDARIEPHRQASMVVGAARIAAASR